MLQQQDHGAAGSTLRSTARRRRRLPARLPRRHAVWRRQRGVSSRVALPGSIILSGAAPEPVRSPRLPAPKSAVDSGSCRYHAARRLTTNPEIVHPGRTIERRHSSYVLARWLFGSKITPSNAARAPGPPGPLPQPPERLSEPARIGGPGTTHSKFQPTSKPNKARRGGMIINPITSTPNIGATNTNNIRMTGP